MGGSEIVRSASAASVLGQTRVGGLVGDNAWAGAPEATTKIEIAEATGAVSHLSINGATDSIGGLVGRNSGLVSTVYAMSGATGGAKVGGLVGENLAGGTVTSGFATGTVTGTNAVGGAIGSNAGSASALIVAGQLVGTSDFGGVIGLNEGSIATLFYDHTQANTTASTIGRDTNTTPVDLSAGSLTTAQARTQAACRLGFRCERAGVSHTGYAPDLSGRGRNRRQQIGASHECAAVGFGQRWPCGERQRVDTDGAFDREY